MRFFFSLIVIINFSNFVFAQNNIDTLKQRLSVYSYKDRVDILNDISKFYNQIDLDSTLLYCNEAISLAKLLNYKQGIADAYSNYSSYWYYREKNDSVIKYSTKSLEYIDTTKSSHILVKYYNSMGLVARDKNNFEEAENYFQKVYKVGMQINDTLSVVYSYINRGINHNYHGRKSKAIEYYNKALDFAGDGEFKGLASIALKFIGDIYVEIGESDKGIEILKKAYKINSEQGIEYRKMTVCLSLCNAYIHIFNFKEAVNYARQGFIIAKNINSIEHQARIGAELCFALSMDGKSDSSILVGKQLLSNCSFVNDTTSCILVYSGLADSYSAKKKFKKALKNCNEALLLADKSGGFVDIIVAQHACYKYYVAVGDFEKANKHLIKINAYQDSVTFSRNRNRINELSYEYKLAQSEKINSNLKIESHNLIQKDLRQRHYIGSLIIGIVFISLVLISIYINLRNKRKANYWLRSKNKVIYNQKEELTATLEELDVVVQKLKESNATKDKFFSIIAHDLKNPFSSIMSMSELFLRRIETIDRETATVFIKELSETSKNTYLLLNNLLTWAQSQQEQIVLNPNLLNLNKIVNNSILPYKSFASNKNINLINEIPNSVSVYCDADSMNTVFGNLINNAIKFTKHGGEVVISSEVVENKVVVSFADNGIGMKTEQLENIFRIDKSVSTPGTEKEKGTGLGLILCKEFVEMNNGIITVESQVGKGTFFYVNLPINKN